MDLICISLNTSEIKHILCVSWYSGLLFCEMPVDILCPFFYSVVFDLYIYEYFFDPVLFLAKYLPTVCGLFSQLWKASFIKNKFYFLM